MGPHSSLIALRARSRRAILLPSVLGSLLLAVASCSDGNVLTPGSGGPHAVVVAEEGMCGTVYSTPLIAGQKTNIGSVKVTNDETTLYITLTTTAGWTLAESHVAVAATKAGLPVNKQGNPEPGQFALKASHGAGTTSFTYSMPRGAFAEGAPFFVAAQADVKKGSQSDGAWGQGSPFVTRGSWAMYFTVTLNPCQGLVRGRVIDFETQAPLAESMVKLGELAPVATAQDGTFSLDNVHVGTYALTVSDPAFHPLTLEGVAVLKNADTDVGDLALRARKGTIAGRIVDLGNNAPVPNAKVVARQDGVVKWETVTAAEGTFASDSLRIGAYDVTVESPLHFADFKHAVAVASLQQTDLGDWALRPLTGEVTGTVADKFTHGALAGVAVRLSSGTFTYDALTGADGSYSLSDVRIGTYKATFSIADFDSGEITPVQIGAGGTAALGTIELRPFTGYFGPRVGDALTTAPLANATIEVHARGATVATLHTDASGHAEVELRIGEYTAVATADRFHPSVIVPFTVTHAGTASLDINLQPMLGAISGAMLDQPTGAGLSGSVSLRSLATNEIAYTQNTGPDGRYSFDAVRIGDYALEFAAPEHDDRRYTPIRITDGVRENQDGQLMPWMGYFGPRVGDALTTQPLNNATVQVFSEGTLVATLTTDATGHAEAHLRVGQYTAIASHGLYHPSSAATFTVTRAGTASLDINLAPKLGSIFGAMLDQPTEAGLVGTVRLRSLASNEIAYTAQAGPEGRYSFDAVRIGDYAVEFAADEHDPRTITPITVTDGGRQRVNAEMMPWMGYFGPRVGDALTTQPLNNATVQVFSYGNLVATLNTDATGHAEAHLRVGQYTAIASHGLYQPSSSVAFTVTHAGTASLDINLQPKLGSVWGAIADQASHAGLIGTVTLRSLATNVVYTQPSGPDGTYSFDPVPIGDYAMEFTAPQHEPFTSPITITDGGRDRIDADLVPWMGYLAIQARQQGTTTPIIGATVQVYSGATQVGTATSATPYGQTEFHLRVGSYRVVVSHPLYVTATVQDLTVTHAGTTSQDVLLLPSTGTIAGTVQTTGGAALAGATVQVLSGTTVINGTTARADGTFGPVTVNPGSYTVRATAVNYVPVTKSITVTAGGAFDLGIFALALANGSAQGNVVNATNGAGISGAIVEFLSGSTVITSTTTNSSGGFGPISLNPGSYTARATASGFTVATTPVTVNPGATTYVGTLSLSPLMPEGQVRAILTWGSSPTDLDSHLTGPNGSGGRFHVYYGYPSFGGATLDHDDVTSYGPETITFTQNNAGIYRYSIYNYSKQVELRYSSAVVTVYRGNTQIGQYTVPNQAGYTWTVFELNGTTLTPINTISYNGPSLMAAGSAPQLEDDSQLIANAIRRYPKK